ncbi:mitochondrial coenzyme A diphosphatase NUDT8-like [Saccoglossus kowalevskii]|uniref:Nucleoside diphosphate-linked moiety X motif 8, mitochondrial-like isoform X1 n=1 Tax=Saccoglossus kowalevskii TaxID=10224 RepID=A0ABM0LW66_SACKO|nr:PREDICTED: nucleoside diphosphate-linked moiety X motif 8, mitochondrial-like isoform X1 [Saccoglossus kowalevskii]XP_006812008.1 PREDICTED: nucleoside diphosphate-linked moiety X motif 8, mitochondrial-like isoform X2 [Saccoglossus kowalevskii]
MMSQRVLKHGWRLWNPKIISKYSTWCPWKHIAHKNYSSDSVRYLSSVFSDENVKSTIKRMSNVRPLRKMTKDAELTGAVLVPLCVVDGEPSVLYTLRSNHLALHRGEVSFPGGMSDPNDEDITHTALREMEEELGVNAAAVRVWGSLIPLPDKTLKRKVTPIVGFLGDINIESLKPNANEVEQVFSLTLSHLCNPQNQRYTRFAPYGKRTKTYQMPVFLGGPIHRVWGLTSIITDQLLRALLPDVYKSPK